MNKIYNQTDFIIPIILDSHEDLIHGQYIYNKLKKYGLNSVLRIYSIIKVHIQCLQLLDKYNSNPNVLCYITISSKSNILGSFIDGLTLKPVFSCILSDQENKHNSIIYNSNGLFNSTNIIYSVLKTISLVDTNFELIVKDIQNEKINILRIEDLKLKYNDEEIVQENYNMPEKLNTNNLIYSGKIRSIYSIDNEPNILIMFGHNKIKYSENIYGSVDYKGAILNRISKWWFNECDFVPNHINGLEHLNNDSRCLFVHKAKVIQIEFLMYGYMNGLLWKNYEKGIRNFCGHQLMDNYKKNEKLKNIVLIPIKKKRGFNNNTFLNEELILKNNILNYEQWNICKKYAYELFRYSQNLMLSKGMILAYTKYEFGFREDNGMLILINELHNPEISQYWIQHSYQKRFDNKIEPEEININFVKEWINNNNDNSKNNIEIPKSILDKCSKVYYCLEEIICN